MMCVWMPASIILLSILAGQGVGALKPKLRPVPHPQHATESIHHSVTQVHHSTSNLASKWEHRLKEVEARAQEAEDDAGVEQPAVVAELNREESALRSQSATTATLPDEDNASPEPADVPAPKKQPAHAPRSHKSLDKF